jgi:HK97 family phage major capsid protein
LQFMSAQFGLEWAYSLHRKKPHRRDFSGQGSIVSRLPWLDRSVSDVLGGNRSHFHLAGYRTRRKPVHGAQVAVDCPGRPFLCLDVRSHPMKTHLRELSLDADLVDTKKRIAPAVISTTYPVDRDGFLEVLLHGPDNVDLSRAPLPLIESHDGRRLNIGLVENLRLESGKLRGDIVFGKSARASELWPDVLDGIVRSVSVAYLIHASRPRGDTVEVTRWQPFEVSLVSIPADPNAGTYRSFTMQNENEGQPAGDAGERMSRSARRSISADASLAQRALVAERELARVTEIRETGNAYRNAPGWRGVDTAAVANKAIDDGLTVEQFREAMMAAVETLPVKTADPNTAAAGRAFSRNGKRSISDRTFSISRALAGAIDPKVDNGFEREVSQEMARQLGRQPRGIYMPTGHLSERTLSVSGAAALVGEESMGSEFIDGLRARSFVMQLGARVLSGLTADVSIPRLTASATSGWIAGDGADGLTESTPTVDAVTLTPKTVGALTVLSRKMILQGDPDSEQLIRDDFAKLIAVELDRAAIAGSGSGNQPTGIVNASGVSTGTFPIGGPTFASMLAMEAALMADNADQGSLAYLTTPALAGALKGIETATGSGQFVWTAGRERGQGSMNGLPAYASSNVPLDKVVLGNWEDLLMGMWGAIDLEVNPYHDFAKGNVAVRIFASVDFAVRHGESFAVWDRAIS